MASSSHGHREAEERPDSAPAWLRRLRSQAAALIHQTAAVLRLQASTRTISKVLFHRVYLDASFADLEPFLTAVACVFIAGKANDDFRKARDVATAAWHVIDAPEGDDGPPLPVGGDLDRWKLALLEREQRVLRLLAYDCRVPLPIPYLLNMALTVRGWDPAVARVAVCIANDACALPLCLEYTAVEQAGGSLWLASTLLDAKAPNPPEDGGAWAEFGVDSAVFADFAGRMLGVYETPEPPLRGSDIAAAMGDWYAASPTERRERYAWDAAPLVRCWKERKERESQPSNVPSRTHRASALAPIDITLLIGDALEFPAAAVIEFPSGC